jgi:hypothetical protein
MQMHFSKHDLVSKVMKLQRQFDSAQWSKECEREWEKIDKLLSDARLSSEGKCTAKLAGQIPWSPALQKAGRRSRYWRLRLCAYTTKQANQKELQKLASQLQLSAVKCGHQPNTAIRQQIRKSRRALTAAKDKAQELRDEHMRERAAFLEATHGMSAKAACNAIAARERSSRQFRQLRSIMHTGATYGLDRIDVPNNYAVRRRGEDIPRIPLVTREAIEEVLVPHTEQRFRQHQETPFGEGERQKALGMDCLTTNAKALMNGTYDRDLEKLTDEARVWLRGLRMKTFIQEGKKRKTKY